MQECAPARVDDRAVDDDARIAHEPIEERPEARVLAEGGGTRGARGLQDVGGLVEELAGEEPPLVRRVPERDPRERGKVRGGHDGHHEEDDEREAEQLAGAGAQSHEAHSLRGRAGSCVTAAGCTGSACCGAS